MGFRCSALCWILHGICPLSLLFRPAAPPLVVPSRELRRRSMCRRGFPSFCGLGRGCDVWLWKRCSSTTSCRGRCPSSSSSRRSIGPPWGRGVPPVSVAPLPLALAPAPCPAAALGPWWPNAAPPHPAGGAVDAAAAPVAAPVCPPPPKKNAPEPSVEDWKSEGADVSLTRLVGGNSLYFASIA